ncbi:MAG: FAD-binding oxidoreductase [Anaerolineae bacterium]|nr:FAD-binding oxidoreductase [Thermoflexales bacterium]MDW8408384.1 FAD-binding oxidoreductase [Anaerolineae bacterium]
MSGTFDVVVVGAGYIGCAVACHAAMAGLRTLLIERGEIGAGASRANYGNVQVQDAELAHSLPLTVAGLARFPDLEAQLGAAVGYRRLGSLLLIETEAQWQTMAARLARLHAAGIPAELVPAAHIPEIEPLLDPRTVLGACYHAAEGQVAPFALLWAYLRRGRAYGLTVRTHTDVLEVGVAQGRVIGVRTEQGTIHAGAVVLTTGAWTNLLAAKLGRTWPIQHVRGQALVTEATSLRLNNHIASAAFFEDIENVAGGAVLAISQTAHGHFLLGEAAYPDPALTSQATADGARAIAAVATHFFPGLRSLRVLRTWAAPVASTPDGLPCLGPVADVSGLFIATAFKSTVIVTPIVGELMVDLILGRSPAIDVTPFLPDRRSADAHHP